MEMVLQKLPLREYGGVRFQRITLPPEPDDLDNADMEFPVEAKILIKEIDERVKKLEVLGIKEVALKMLFRTKHKLSTIVITKDFKIFLPDYNNMEVKLQPLQKAVYILFLLHPDGIIFKELVDYKAELTEIYKNITSREHSGLVQQSLDNVTDSTKNTINEVCSKIREAFISKFDDSLARHYYITGEKATPKKITLSRTLVKLEF